MPPRILMCPPDFYGIEYEINPWMSRSRGSDRTQAQRQWNGLVAVLRELGAEIELVPPVPGLPDMVFTANAGMIYREEAYLSRFRYAVRAGEVPHFERWFAEHGFRPRHLPGGIVFEGAGDALFCGETLFAGYLIRSEVRGHQWLAEQIGCPLIAVELVDPRYYHLDTCFCPVEADLAIWYPPAFDEYGRRAVREHVAALVEVNDAEAQRFACNAVVVGRTVVVNSGCEQLETDLQQRGYATRCTPLDEFLKAGGSAKCLTLRLDGEEAAAWK